MTGERLATYGIVAFLGLCLFSPSPRADTSRSGAPDRLTLEFDDPVELLMSTREALIFRSLTNPRARERFLSRFWGTEGRLPQGDWERRLLLAKDEFPDLRSDRAQLFLIAGPPIFRLSDICSAPVARHEVWHYADDGSKTVVFVAAGGAASNFRLWRAGDWSSILEAPVSDSPGADLAALCDRGAELAAALDAHTEPTVDRTAESGWVEEFLAETTLLPEGALRFDATVEMEFPSSVNDETATLIVLDVPGYEPQADSQSETRAMLLTGEIFDVPERKFVEDFRLLYSGSAEGENGVRLSARRNLSPGRYRMVLKLHDLARDRYFHTEQEFDVPSVVTPRTRLTEPGRQIFKLLPPPEGYLIGPQRFDTMTRGYDIAKVSFLLDGRRMMSKSRAPYSLELDLGHVPRPREVEALAYDKNGVEIARDRISVNSGPHRFTIRLVHPLSGSTAHSSMRVHAEVDTPLGERLSHVDFFWNERHLARLYQAPFVHNFEPPELSQSSFLRAVAVLEDGHSAEDLVVLNTSSTMETIEIDFVEIYASVLDSEGHAVKGLGREGFRVFEDDVEQEIRRFETVDSLPINALVVLDSSESMVEEIDDSQKAAAQFFESVLEPKDRAAVMVFSDTPLLRVGLTNNAVLLKNGLAGIEAGGETSLYDTLVYGLYYLAGLRGKRALILLSDGADSVSEFSFDDALDYARRSGVAIYSIGLGLSKRDIEAQGILRRLARETGGESFSIANTRRLDRIYGQIEEELRSQYLLGYQSPQVEADAYRQVRVEIDADGLEVKAVPGYYP